MAFAPIVHRGRRRVRYVKPEEDRPEPAGLTLFWRGADLLRPRSKSPAEVVAVADPPLDSYLDDPSLAAFGVGRRSRPASARASLPGRPASPYWATYAASHRPSRPETPLTRGPSPSSESYWNAAPQKAAKAAARVDTSRPASARVSSSSRPGSARPSAGAAAAGTSGVSPGQSPHVSPHVSPRGESGSRQPSPRASGPTDDAGALPPRQLRRPSSARPSSAGAATPYAPSRPSTAGARRPSTAAGSSARGVGRVTLSIAEERDGSKPEESKPEEPKPGEPKPGGVTPAVRRRPASAAAGSLARHSPPRPPHPGRPASAVVGNARPLSPAPKSEPSEVVGGTRGGRDRERDGMYHGVPGPPGMRFYAKAEVLRIKKIFDSADVDGSGSVSLKELMDSFAAQIQIHASSDHVSARNESTTEKKAARGEEKGNERNALDTTKAVGSTIDQLSYQALLMMDKDKSGTVDFEEYLIWYFPKSNKFERKAIRTWVTAEFAIKQEAAPKPKPRLSAEQTADIGAIFELINISESGRLTRAELALGLDASGCSAAEVDDMFRKHAEGKEYLTRDDFVDALAASFTYKHAAPAGSRYAPVEIVTSHRFPALYANH